jgi:hypothetical protein
MTEEVEVEEKVIKDMPKTRIIQRGDKTIYFCKKCKQEFDSEAEWRRHLHACGGAGKKKKEEVKGVDEPVSLTKESDTQTIPEYLLPPEDRMVLEMKNKLKEMMKNTPGMSDGKAVEWFCDQFFMNVKALQEDPGELYRALQKHFPRATEDAISLIVRSVFQIREQYERSLKSSSAPPGWMFTRERRLNRGGGFNMFSQQGFDAPPSMDPQVFSMWLMYQMWRDIRESVKQPAQQVDVEQLVKSIKAEIENEYLKKQLEEYKDLVNRVMEIQPRTISTGEWKDDYARLVEDLGLRLLDLGEKLLEERTKTRRLLVNKVMPRVLGEKEVGTGETSKEIIEELDEEYVEEE